MAAATRALVVLGAVAIGLTACGGDTRIPETEAPATVELTSTAFAEGASIPVRYTCDGDGVSPPLALTGLPEGTAALALVMEDPDAPSGTYVHWVAYDVEPRREVPEDVGTLGTGGINDAGSTGYAPPCPPGPGHRYVFEVYALDGPLGLPAASDAATLRAAMDGHVLAAGRLVGRYREP